MTLSQSFELVNQLLARRAGAYSPLGPLFNPHLEELRAATGLPNGSIPEIIFNAQNQLMGRGRCLVCDKETKLYPSRGGWAKYCSKKCMNSEKSERHQKSEATKNRRGTGIGAPGTRAKAEKTLTEKYGANNPSLINEFVVKRRKTFNDKYNCDSPLSSPEVQQKIRETMAVKYNGTGRSSDIIGQKITQTVRQNVFSNIANKLEQWEIISDAAGLHDSPIHLRHCCGVEIKKYAWAGQHLFHPRCPKCHGSSDPQKKIIEVLDQLGVLYVINDRKLISPKELDIFIPQKRVAIEINGIFFHGERYGKDKHYHLNKSEACAKHDVQLLHFTDYDINNRWSAVENTIKSKLNVLEKIHARKCVVRELLHAEASDFLNKYHMQGNCQAQVRLGLYSHDELVAVMTFGKARFTKHFKYELLRYAAKYAVAGGASKLLSAFRKNHVGSIISYADRRWSMGKMYQTLGFTYLGVSPPGYWYTKDGSIHHRIKFQRHKLNDPSQLSEAQIMQLRGYDRMWDCGSLKYALP